MVYDTFRIFTLAIISLFLDVDGRTERRRFQWRFYPLQIDGTTQTLVYDPLLLRRMLAAIIDTFLLWFSRF